VGAELDSYRQHLVLAEQKAVEDFDKAVMTLSGGALGVSFAFIRDVVGPRPWADTTLMFAAWLCWGISVAAVLASYYFSHIALRRAIAQVDDDTIYVRRPGGACTIVIYICNASGGLLFLVGVVLIAVFVSANLGG
jgi:hypothetical protein